MASSLLSGFRALDLTDEKGFICGKMLANLGVDVIKIEKPNGDTARNIPPFYSNKQDTEKSLYWSAFNTNKRGITLNLEEEKGRDLFLRLAVKADFVIESFSPGHLDKRGTGYTALIKKNPRIIMTSITHFGQKGPYSQYKGSELIDIGMSGVLDNTGHPDRPPVKEALESSYFLANAAAALATVIAHYNRRNSGKGDHIDISIQEVNTGRCSINLLIWDFDKRLLKRSFPIGQYGAALARGTWQCKDGYVRWSLSGGQFGAATNRAISKWMDEDGIENPFSKVENLEDLDMVSMTRGRLEEYESAISKFFLKHSKKEIEIEGRIRGINATVINNPSEVMENPHLKAREYWAPLNSTELNTQLLYPRHLFLNDQTDNFINRPAPEIGQHNAEIYQQELGFSDAEIASLIKANII